MIQPLSSGRFSAINASMRYVNSKPGVRFGAEPLIPFVPDDPDNEIQYFPPEKEPHPARAGYVKAGIIGSLIGQVFTIPLMLLMTAVNPATPSRPRPELPPIPRQLQGMEVTGLDARNLQRRAQLHHTLQSQPVRNIQDISNHLSLLSDYVKPAVVHLRAGRGQGSGFLYRHQGRLVILTNHHILQHPQTLEPQAPTVTLYNGQKLQGEVLGSLPFTDLAAVGLNEEEIGAAGLDAKTLPALELATEDPKTGELAAAFGNPLGALGWTMTFGIISADSRQTRGGSASPKTQTDTPINPGNSGGPLVNMQGKVLGMNTETAYGFQNLNFSIPASVIREHLNLLISNSPSPNF